MSTVYFVSGLPKTTLRFDVSLEELIELGKAVIFLVTGFFFNCKRIQIKISKAPRDLGVQETPDSSLQMSSSSPTDSLNYTNSDV